MNTSSSPAWPGAESPSNDFRQRFARPSNQPSPHPSTPVQAPNTTLPAAAHPSAPIPSTESASAARAASGLGGGQAPSRLDRLHTALNSTGLRTQISRDMPHTLEIFLEDTLRFRLMAPPQAVCLMLVADVFSGSEQEIGQMAPSLLHANYTCQRMAMEHPLAMGNMQGEGESEAQWLPVMGLDLERLTVVLSLQIPAQRIEDTDFCTFIASLIDTISHDTDVLVEQFRAVASAMPA